MSKIMERQDYPSNFCWLAHYPTRNTSFKKIDGMVPEIFNVFSFHATHFQPGERKLCANLQHFSCDAAQFLWNLIMPVIIRKTLQNMLNDLLNPCIFLFFTLPGKSRKLRTILGS